MSPAPEAKVGCDFIKAVMHGNASEVRAFPAVDASLATAKEAGGATPLHHAAWRGHAEVTEILLEVGADVNARSTNEHYGGTPLHAAAHGNQRAAEIHLHHGADIRVRSSNGRISLEEPQLHNASAVRDLLRKHGAEA